MQYATVKEFVILTGGFLSELPREVFKKLMWKTHLVMYLISNYRRPGLISAPLQ